MSELYFDLPTSITTANTNIDTYIIPDKTPKISAEELNTTLKSTVDVFDDVYNDINTVAASVSALETTVSGLHAKDYLTIKGSLQSVDDLPTDDNTIGDLYFVNTDEYIWSGTEWVCLGPLITVPSYTVHITIPSTAYSNYQSYGGWTTFNISADDIEKFKSGEVTSVIVDDQKNKIKGVAPASFYQVTNSNGSFTHDTISFSLSCSSGTEPSNLMIRCYALYRVWDSTRKPVKISWKEISL